MTEQVRASESARTIEARYRRLVRDSLSSITLSTLDGRLLAVNPAFVKLVGAESESQLLRLPATAFYAADDRDRIVTEVREKGELHDVELPLRRLDGSVRLVRMRARLVEGDHAGEQYFQAMAEDITESREIERQLLQAQKMEAVGQLAGGLAHDFNNVLTVILANTELALDTLSPDEVSREPLEDIASAARSASTLSRQLLVFSRQPTLAPSVHRLNGLVDNALRMVRRAITEAVRLDVRLDDRVGAVHIDPAQFEQVLVNLAINASDAMPHGGTLSICTESGTLAASQSLATEIPAAVLVVQDTGVGMDEATLTHIFEPFFTTKAKGRGTGLGLASTYAIVHHADGEIAATSTKGVGTTFRISLPSVADTADTSDASHAFAPAQGSEHVLVVEDHQPVRAMMANALRARGYSVSEAADGREALDLARTQEPTIDLLVTDVVMPELGGRELADHFTEVRPQTRVLFVSGYTEDTVLAERVRTDAASFLAKPFTGDELARKVRETLDRPASNPATTARADLGV